MASNTVHRRVHCLIATCIAAAPPGCDAHDVLRNYDLLHSDKSWQAWWRCYPNEHHVIDMARGEIIRSNKVSYALLIAVSLTVFSCMVRQLRFDVLPRAECGARGRPIKEPQERRIMIVVRVAALVLLCIAVACSRPVFTKQCCMLSRAMFAHQLAERLSTRDLVTRTGSGSRTISRPGARVRTTVEKPLRHREMTTGVAFGRPSPAASRRPSLSASGHIGAYSAAISARRKADDRQHGPAEGERDS